uniref:Protein kinase domain-containing protein n=1 Tax=Acrobeloides nanus TaxID=290746 RepID=A0A914E1W0_9BILA
MVDLADCYSNIGCIDDIFDVSDHCGLTIISKKFIRNLGQKLGEGAFGIVYKGELTLDEDNKNQSQKYYIAIKEIKGYFLYGVDNSQNSSLNEIIMEKIEIQFCHQIAAAMSYLSDKQIVHGDLATRNVLIACDTVSAKKENSEFSNLAAQVSDFGLAQIIDKNLTKNNDILPFRWAAIECLKGYKTGSYIFNQKTDVWSFGVTIWEIFSYGRTPYDELFEKHVKSTTETTYSLFSDELNRIINSGGSTRKSSLNDMIKVLLDFLLNGERLPRPLICKDEVYLIMLECWRESPEQRRPFEYFETIFKEASKNPNDYVAKIDPRLLSDHNSKNRSLNLGLDPVTYYLSNKMPEHNPLLNQQQITEQDSGISADRHRSKNDDSNIEQ